jgi:hypothetical protein
MAIAAAGAVKAATGWRIWLRTAPEFAALARCAPAIDGIGTDLAEMRLRLAAEGCAEPRIANWSAAAFGISHLHQVDAFLASLGLGPPDETKGLALDLPDAPDETAALLAGLPAGGRRVVLHPCATDRNRAWPPQLWRALAERFAAAGHGVVQIGSGAGCAPHPHMRNLIDLLDPIATLRLLRRCDLLVSADAGPIQLAGASDIAIVGLYSVVAGARRLPYRRGSTAYKTAAIAPHCPFHPCYPRLRDPAAVARFCAAEGIDPADLRQLFARWCVNPERYACTGEAATLDEVMAAAERLLAPPA